MKKLLTLTVPALLVASIATADAADVRGRVDSVNPEAQTFTLKNGATFRYGDNVAVQDLVPDAKVKVAYKSNRGTLEARKVKVVGAPRD